MKHDLLSRKILNVFPLLVFVFLLFFPAYLSSTISEANAADKELILAENTVSNVDSNSAEDYLSTNFGELNQTLTTTNQNIDTITVSGTIDTDQTWYASEGEYIIDGDVTVAEGTTLTIEPGVDVLFENSLRDLYVEGTLIARGTAQDSIRFQPVPGYDGYAGTIRFRPTSEGSVLDYVHLDRLRGSYVYGYGAVSIHGSSSVQVTNSSIVNSENNGLHLGDGAQPEIHSNTFVENGRAGIRARTVNSLANVGSNDVETIVVRGTVTEPILWRLNDQTQYIIDGDVTVAEGTTLTIEPGVDVLFENSLRDLYVEGTLIARGTAQDSIRFQPVPGYDGYAGTIRFRPTSEGSVLDYVHLDRLRGSYVYGYGAVSIHGSSSVQVTNSSIVNSENNGLHLGDGAQPEIHSNTFVENGRAGIRARTVNSLANVGSNDVETIVVRGTVTEPILWRLNDQTQYIIDGDVTVAEGTTLTIEPGVDVLFENSLRDLYVEGTLLAEGTANNLIKFLPSPAGNRFSGKIHFRSSSKGSVLDYVMVKNLAGNNSYGAVNIYGTDGVMITNSTIMGSQRVGLHLDDNAQPDIRGNIFLENEYEDIRVHTPNSLTNIGANDVSTISVRGTISSPITWRLNDNTQYILVNDVTIAEGATLTIEPGVEVLLPSSNTDLEVEGTLLAEGTANNTIKFQPGPAGDNYGGNIQFRSPSVSSILDHVEIMNLTGGNNTGAISIYGTGDVLLKNSVISGSWESGLYIDDGANPVIRRSMFEDNHYGIIVSGTSTPDLGLPTEDGQNIFINNTEYAVKNNTSGSILAVGNFWNSTSSSVIDNRIYDDDEDLDSGPVVFEPFLDEAPEFDKGDDGELIITSIEPNTIVGSNSDQTITVNGNGFEEGAFVILDDLKDDQAPFENPSKTTYVNSQELTREATFTDNASTWSAQVENPDGSRSDTIQFEVLSPDQNEDRNFAYPVGSTGFVTEANDGDGWYNAQDFGVANSDFDGMLHLGEDWNAESGGNTDLGEPVYAASSGTIVYAENAGASLGNVVVIRHTLSDDSEVETVYAHLESIVKHSGTVEIQEQIGTIGDADGYYNSAHLHFGLRLQSSTAWGEPGPGYAYSTEGWTDPSDFIDASTVTSDVYSVSFNLPSDGPQGTSIDVPENGNGYIYYNMEGEAGPFYSEENFTIGLLDNTQSISVDVTSRFLEEDLIQIEIPHDLIQQNDPTEFQINDTFAVGETEFKLNGQEVFFNASSADQYWTRTWSIFAGGSAGVSGSLGSIGAGVSAAAAKASISGEGGIGLDLQINGNDRLSITRRFSAGIASSIEAPSVNLGYDNIDIDAGINTELVSKLMGGQTFSFSQLNLEEDQKKMAQTGLILETLSLGGVALSPTVGLVVSATVNTINNLGNVDQLFEPASVSSFVGIGLEGSVNSGIGFRSGPINISAAEASTGFVLNGYLKNYESIVSEELTKIKLPSQYRFDTQELSHSIDISFMSQLDLSAYSWGVNFGSDDLIGLSGASLFAEGISSEMVFSSNFNQNNELEFLEFSIAEGGDLDLFTMNRSNFRTTTVQIPANYAGTLLEAGSNLISGTVPENSILFGNSIVDDFQSSFNLLTSSIGNEAPLHVLNSELRGKGLEYNYGVTLDGAFGVGLGLSLGFDLSLYDEIEFTSDYSQIFTGGKNYVMMSSNYDSEMEEEQLKDIIDDLFSGAVPLLEEAIRNLTGRVREIFEDGVDFVVNIFGRDSEEVGRVSGSLAQHGEYFADTYSPRSNRIVQKAFDTPEVRNSYSSPNVLYSPMGKAAQMEPEKLLEVGSEVIIISQVTDMSFIPEGESESVDELDSSITLELEIKESDLVENEFDLSDMDRVRIYRYDLETNSWIRLNGELDNNTLVTDIQKMGSYALGIEINRSNDEVEPDIYDSGFFEETDGESLGEIFANLRDDRYGSGIDFSQSYLILNGDTLGYTLQPSQNRIFYQINEEDNLNGNTEEVRIVATDLAGNQTEESFTFELVTTNNENDNESPGTFELMDNYPNPFNPQTVIPFSIPEAVEVQIRIYDVLGRYVATLLDEKVQAGHHEVVWNSGIGSGQELSTGVYFYQIKAGEFNQVKKMTYLK